MSARSKAGRAGAGKPFGTGPTTATPWATSPNAATATVAPTKAMRTAGTFGASALKAKSSTRQASPMARAAALVRPSATPTTNSLRRAGVLSAVTLKPNSLGSWLTTTTTATPLR